MKNTCQIHNFLQNTPNESLKISLRDETVTNLQTIANTFYS